MTSPAPRPALRKAPDAHIHPAAPAHDGMRLRPAAEGEPEGHSAAPPAAPASAPLPGPRPATDGGSEPKDRSGAAAGRKPSGPLKGITSDSLRAAGRHGGRARRDERAKEKKVELAVQVPKSLRKEFQAATRSRRTDPDAVVEALLRAWLDV